MKSLSAFKFQLQELFFIYGMNPDRFVRLANFLTEYMP